MKNNIIVPIGYMGSGSSAITDLVSEFRGYEAKASTFEYVFLHCPNGLFDLEDKLLISNNTLRSDEALHSFYSTMKQLYNKKFWWVGHYKDIVGKEFLSTTEEFIDSLIQCKPSFYWYNQENVNSKMFFKLLLNKVITILTLNHVKLKKPLLYPEMWLSYVKPEEFYNNANKYLNKVFDMMGVKQNNIILDQLLLPQNVHRIDNYFDDNMKAFVVERDPRDVFIINKYIWSKRNEPVPFSIDVEEFCIQYRLLREMEKHTNSDKVMYIKFEDLIYKYEETVQLIIKFLGLTSSDHINKKSKFVPELSINNTQLFRVNEEYEAEGKIIEDLLPEYIYNFPYKNEINVSKTF